MRLHFKKRVAVCSVAALLFSASGAFAAQTQGFLTPETAPDSLQILPPPPAENTVMFLNDKAAYETGKTLKDAKRQALAASDADYKNISAAFSAAFGEEISQEKTPALYALLQGVLQDSHDYAMRTAKDHYMRVRPFVVYKDSTCTPEKDKSMAKTGSYPSGHASFGWATALVLAEINPARETEILKRGYDFGQSRVVCGAHWQSDVDNGRLMGAAVVAMLHSNQGFTEALAKAKAEFGKR
ncbi:acid phosphatase [Serratia rhizosphaerae]|uniref:acid phosphatase n=1 Tax=Serratia rhizosphaerae TaxID=2597702 RepID=UPI002DC7C65E|nr:phosphatase PAP2 family protein [Serratia rhizosphaerae]